MYDINIPGQVSEFQLQAIETVASLIPANGAFVEVGALFGRSSYCWAKSVPASARVFSVDPWERNDGVKSLEAAHGIKYGIEQFKEYTKDCDNLTAMQGYSPNDFTDWSMPIDGYYEDAVHTNPILRQNLDFWVSHLKPGGVVCGDDYRPRFTDVVCEVRNLARKLDRDLHRVDFFWCLLPKFGGPEIRAVSERLKELEVQSRRAYKFNPSSHTLQVLDMDVKLVAGEQSRVTLRLTNESRDQWPGWFEGYRINVVLENGKEEHRVIDLDIEPELFPPDLGRDLLADLLVPAAAKGSYNVRAEIVDPAGSILRNGRIGLNVRQVSVKS